jgi:hypothetical protein
MNWAITPRKHGFTLVEAVVATTLGVVVLGGASLIYHHGNKTFANITEHSSFRQEALLALETIDKDLKGLIVGSESVPGSQIPAVLQPFVLFDPKPQKGIDPKTKEEKEYQINSGLRFFRYAYTHSIEGLKGPTPQLVGQLVEYKVEPIGDGKRGVNLLRNGRKINKQPLSGVLFEPIEDQIEGSAPNALLRVTIVPTGGMWGSMSPDTIRRLRDDGKVVSRMIHLVGYESRFTLLLWMAKAKRDAGVTLSDVEERVLPMLEGIPPTSRRALLQRINEINDRGYELDDNRVFLDAKVKFDDTKPVGRDTVFDAAPEEVVFSAADLRKDPGGPVPLGSTGFSASSRGADLSGI